jgi:hypothetical protein
MYLTEAQKEDEQVTKNWFEDTGGVLVFVSCKTRLIFVLHVPKSNVVERSSLGHCCDLPHFKPPQTLSRFGQSDGRVARPARQQLHRNTRRSAE